MLPYSPSRKPQDTQISSIQSRLIAVVRMYQFLSQQWSQWLPASQVASVVSGEGAYTIKQGNLRIISLNTVMCYVDNFYTLVDFANYDKGGQLGFVNQQLALAEQNGEPVWIISHVGEYWYQRLEVITTLTQITCSSRRQCLRQTME